MSDRAEPSSDLMPRELKENIVDFISNHGGQASADTIATVFGVEKTWVNKALLRLVKWGKVERCGQVRSFVWKVKE